MSELAAHPAVRGQFTVIAQALELSASAQIRNMASIGGNLMQRPRCLYFRDVSAACNRRTPGSGCAAIGGRNRTHAILGTSDACVATHPSDLAVALTALDAAVITREGGGERRIPIADFFRRPGTTPDQEHNMGAGALITAIEVPVVPEARRSGYLKVRPRGPRRCRRRRDGAVAVARGRTSSCRPDRGYRPVARCRVTCRGRR
jgi:xanthine dehydrogenase YagS FAD-binding subunit